MAKEWNREAGQGKRKERREIEKKQIGRKGKVRYQDQHKSRLIRNLK